MAAIKCFLLDTNLDHSLATIKFDIWLKFCSNRSIINLAIGQKLSKTADWTIKRKMAARKKFWQGKTLNHSRDLIELDIWWKFHQNPRSGLSLTQVFPNMLHLRKCPPLRFSNFLLLPSNSVLRTSFVERERPDTIFKQKRYILMERILKIEKIITEYLDNKFQDDRQDTKLLIGR